ncbi:MAG TPA: PaaX family transcriptional regulator C-terminal domain-containing protein [Actinomycetota bacterium]
MKNVTDPNLPGIESWLRPGGVLTAIEASELPRFQSGFPPQHMLLTLIGEYGLHVGDPMPSASLVLILGEFGVTQAGARAAIARLARRGIFVPTRSGRTTAYAMTERCSWMVAEGRRLTLEFTGALRSWDGHWTLVSYSIAQERRAQRALLRTRLRWLGFAPLQDGLWVSPRPPGQQLHEALADLGVGACAVFVADPVRGPDRLDPLAAWDLDEARAAYAEFIDEFKPVSQALRRGRVSASEALIARTRVTYRWFAFANSQAELPETLLPANWLGAVARQLFEELYDGLGPLAALRIAQHIGTHDAALAAGVRSFTCTEPIDDVAPASRRESSVAE